MKCVICHGDDIQVVEVNEEVRIEDDIIYVPIRVPECRACGERYYDRKTMRFLESVEQKLRTERASLQEVGKVLLYS